MHRRFILVLRLCLLAMIMAGALLPPQSSAYAAPIMSVTPITWNVIGLDSNDPSVGPNHFPIGARVCNRGAGATDATNVVATFVWDNTPVPNYINLRPGTANTINLGSLTAGTCEDAYFEVEVTRSSSAYDKTRRYHIEVTTTETGATEYSTPTPRELYVEHLISQSRNYVYDIKLGPGYSGTGTSVPAGGTMTLMVGQTYDITVNGKTATQGYNQLEEFINFPNTIFQVLNVSTTYSADNSPAVPPPFSNTTMLYGDACKWDNDPGSPTYRACIGGDYKNGGNVDIVYTVKILAVPSNPPALVNPEPLSTLVYDFSGSSYHYNADFSVSTRYAYIINASITKSFSPKTILPGGTSTLTFTITNPGASSISNVNFTDDLPANTSLANTSVAYSGCGASPSPATVSDPMSFSNITVAANSTCTISVTVTSSTAGTHNNTTGNLYIDTTSTGSSASDILIVSSQPPPPSSCTTPVTLASWTMPTSDGPPPPYTTKASDVSTATASAVLTGLGSQSISAAGNPTNAWGITDAWPSVAGAPGATTAPYFDFVVDTSNYGGVRITLDRDLEAPGDWGNATNNIYVYSSADGGAFSTATTVVTSKGSWQAGATAVAASTGSSTTRFTIHADTRNGAKETSTAYLDNVVITGCPRPTLPTLSKSFSPTSIGTGSTSTLAFTLTNPNTNTSLTGVSFSDVLPSGLTVSSSTASACSGGTLTLTSPRTISLTGGTIAASGTCTFNVTVTGAVAGIYNNVSSSISSTETGPNTTATGIGTSTLTIIDPPVIAKSFTANPIFTGASTALTFSINNPNTGTALTGVNFTDTLPAGLVVSTPNGLTNTCAGTATATPASSSVSLSGVTLAAGASCTLTVNVTGTTVGLKDNSVTVGSTNGGTGNTSTASVLVKNQTPAITLLKQVGSTAGGPWSSFLPVNVGGDVYYRFIVENTGDVALTSVNVNDPQVSAAGCSWVNGNTPPVPLTSPFNLPVADANDSQIAICVLGPVTAVSGLHTNTATASGTSGSTVTDSSSATYGTPALTLVKSVTETSFSAIGDVLHYSYLVTNSGGAPLLGPVTVSDDKATVTCPAVNTVGDGDDWLDPADYPTTGTTAESMTCDATYTVTQTDLDAGFVTNTASATANSITSNTESKTVYGEFDLAITKDNGVTSVNAGSSTTYTIRVTNNGPSPITGAILSDPAVAGLSKTAVVCSPTPGQCVTAPSIADIEGTSYALPALASGQFYEIRVTATVTATSGSVTNTATITPPVGAVDFDPTNNTATDTDTVIPVSDLAIIKNDSVATVNAGGSTTYTIRVTNNGPSSVTGAILSDPSVAGLSKTNVACSVTPGQCFTAPNVSQLEGGAFALPALASGQFYEITVTATVTATSGSVTNTATVAPPTGTVDSNDANNSASDVDSVTPIIDLSLDKQVSNATPAVGSNITFTLVIVNDGPSTATNIVVTDIVPDGYTYVAASIAGGDSRNDTNPSTTGLTWTINSLAVNTSVNLTYQATVLGSGTYDNYAEITAHTETDSNSTPNNGQQAPDEDDDDTQVVTPVSIAAPSIAKSFSPNPIAVGATSTLTFTITNPNAGVALTGVAFTDNLPTGLQVATTPNAATAGCGAPTFAPASGNTTLTFSGGTIAASGTCTVTVSVTATSAGTHVNTTGNVTSTNGGTGNTATATLHAFTATPSKSIVTTSEASTGFVLSTERVAIGEMVRYRLVSLIPEGSFTDVQLVDGLPTGLQFLNDGTATVALVCNSGATCMSSSTLSGAGLVVTGASSDVSPTFVVPGAAISGGAFGSGTDVTFSLGNITNLDTDVDSEYVVVEFNALVLNVNSTVTINQGVDNQTGASNTNNRQNDVTLFVNGSQVGSTSPNVTVAIAEPAITSITKSVAPAAPYRAGDALTYTLSFSNNAAGPNATTAFDIALSDTFDANLALGAVNVSSDQGASCAGGTTFSTNNSTVGQLLTVSVSCLDPGRTVTATVAATISSSISSGTNIANSSSLTYTSLPGAQGNCAAAPFSCSGMGGTGSGSGERNGSGGAGADDSVLNNYYTVSNTVNVTPTYGSITIIKNAIPDDPQDFSFAGSGPGFTGNFNLDDDADGTLPNTYTFDNLLPGSFSFVESAVGGWSLTGLTCVDPDSGSTVDLGTATATIDLDAGESITCTFTSTKFLPSIVLTKTPTLNDTVVAPGGVVNPGDTITYAFSVENTGNVTVTNINVTDPLLPTLSCTIASLAPATSASCTATNNVYTLTQADIDAGSRLNTATATGKDPGNNDVADSDARTTPLTQSPSIILTKTPTLNDTVVAPNGVVNAGDTITYTFSVENTGNVTITNVVVTDPLLPALGCSIASLAPGGTASCSATNNVYALTQTDIDAGVRANTATATGKDPGNNDVTDPDTRTTNLAQAPSILLAKTGTLNDDDGTPGLSAGDTISYAFTVTNTGNVTLTNVSIADTIGGVTISGGPIASLAPGASDATTFTATYGITQADINAGTFTNTATVSGTPPSGPVVTDPDDDTQTLTFTASMVLTKTPTLNDTVVAPSGVVNVGDTITYAFSVENTGNVTVTNITVADPLLPTLSCMLASLAPGGTASCTATNNVYTLTQADIDAGSRANTATATGKDPGNNDVTDPDTRTTPLTRTPSILLTKTGTLNDDNSNGTVNAGDTISYAFTVTNTGNVTLTNITLADTVGGVTIIGGPIASLAPGASDSTTFTGTYTLALSDINAGSFTNTATVTGTPPSGADVSDADDDTQTLASTPSIVLTKTPTLDDTVVAPSGVVNVGDTITYTFSVENTGNATVTAIVVTDPLLPTLSCTIASLAPGATASCAAANNVYALTQADINAGSRNNTATATGKGPGNVDVTDSDTKTVTLDQSASLVLTKTATLDDSVIAPGGVANVGDTITYTFSVENTGNVTLTNINVTDPLLPSLSCTVTSLAPGATSSCSATNNVYTLTQTDIDAGSRANTATATGKDPGNNDVTDADTKTTTLGKAPSLSIVKEVSANNSTWNDTSVTVNVGDTVYYRVRVSNTGNITLTGLTVDDGMTACTLARGTDLTGNNDNIFEVGEEWVYTCSVTAVLGVNNNTATASSNETAQVSDTASYSAGAALVADPALSKSGNPTEASIGETVTFILTVTNQGTAPAPDVVVTDALPAMFDVTAVQVTGAPLGTLVNVTPPIGTGSAPYTVVVTLGGDLNASDVVTIQIVTTVNSLGNPPINNTASLTTSALANIISNDFDSVSINIRSTGRLRLPATGFARGEKTILEAQPSDLRYAATDVTLEIPSLNMKIPIVGVPKKNGTWNVSWLGSEAGWLEGSAFPSWNGNSVLTSHVYLPSGLPGPFVNLTKLKYGDTIIVHAYGQKYTFAVQTNQIVSPNDQSVLKHEEKPWLTLITCKDYDEKTRTYRNRVAVRAILVKVEVE